MSPPFKDLDSREASSGPTIFVSDPSAEADRLSNALRGRGYHVIDVPPSMLLARVAVQLPAMILLDIDAEGAIALAAALRDIPGASGIDILFLGEAGRTLANSAEGLRHEGSGFLTRPVDVDVLIRKVEALVGARPSLPVAGSAGSSAMRRPTAPSRERGTAEASGSARLAIGDAWPSRKLPGDDPLDPAFGSEGPALPRFPLPELSREVATLLQRAEERTLQEFGPGSQSTPPSQPPSPEEEVDAVLPAEVLAALDEPLDENDDDFESDSGLSTGAPRRASSAEAITGSAQGSGAGSQTPGPSGGDTTVPPGPRNPESSLAPLANALSDPKELETPRPPRRNAASAVPAVHVPAPPTAPRDTGSSPSTVAPSTHSPSPAGAQSVPPSRPSRRSTPPPKRPSASSALEAMAHGPAAIGRSARSTSAPLPRDRAELEPVEEEPLRPAFALPPVLTPGAALSALAVCVRERATGALCVEAPDGMRRILLREGDVVTAASGLDDESLVAFLGSRGDLRPEVAEQLQGKIPAYGRHAGAALVANGHISQDQLWPVLRAHAEWILRCTISVETGSATFESSPPGRLKAEPSVFGGSTGAEVLIEVVRRAIPPAVAMTSIGGGGVRMSAGARWELLSECALPEWELAWVNRVLGMTVEEALTLATPEALPVVCALSELGVLALEVAPAPAHERRVARSLAAFDPIDAQALRAQVKARLSLVQDGDYFALLGVPRAATSYEINRAYAELRRSLEPSRVLTAATADLADDLTLILEVVEEAHEILRDATRRERYRRAIEDQPPS